MDEFDKYIEYRPIFPQWLQAIILAAAILVMVAMVSCKDASPRLAASENDNKWTGIGYGIKMRRVDVNGGECYVVIASTTPSPSISCIR